MFITLAISFGGSTGAEHKGYYGHNGQTKQKFLHTF
jgi:hypothetical protein